jgi:hypothetical protein
MEQLPFDAFKRIDLLTAAAVRQTFLRSWTSAQAAHVGRPARRPYALNSIGPRMGLAGFRKPEARAVQLRTVVGTAELCLEYDRTFRPTTLAVQNNWEDWASQWLAAELQPSPRLYQWGEAHFVLHAVDWRCISVLRAFGVITVTALVVLPEVAGIDPPTLEAYGLWDKSGKG